MKNYEFEKLSIVIGEQLSFIDLAGNTRYGSIDEYDPSTPSFEFRDKDHSTSETIYLKDVKTIFLKE